MSFDDIPEDKANSQPCPNCKDGNAVENKQGDWHCDTCDWCYIKSDPDNQKSANQNVLKVAVALVRIKSKLKSTRGIKAMAKAGLQKLWALVATDVKKAPKGWLCGLE